MNYLSHFFLLLDRFTFGDSLQPIMPLGMGRHLMEDIMPDGFLAWSYNSKGLRGPLTEQAQEGLLLF